jgi:hypothetical protein
MNSNDNCATVFEEIPENTNINLGEVFIKINQKVPFGHKFALDNINKGEFIKKYGVIIGMATKDIKRGDWIHTHNIKSHYLEEINK